MSIFICCKAFRLFGPSPALSCSKLLSMNSFILLAADLYSAAGLDAYSLAVFLSSRYIERKRDSDLSMMFCFTRAPGPF